MKTPSRRGRLAGAAITLTFVLAGCSGQSTSGKKTGAAPKASASPNTADTGAATLRTTLTQGLHDHVWLAGVAINTAVQRGLDAPATKSAIAALDGNTVSLGQAIGSVYGADAEKAFLPLWRKHIDFFVDYTVAGLKKDAAKQAKAKSDLDGYRNDFGAFLSSANPNLTKDAVANELVPHVQMILSTIDAAIAKDPSVFAKMADAAEGISHTAGVLAAGIAKQMPEKFGGDADAGGATLRSNLTGLLNDHVWLAGIAIDTAVTSGLDSTMTKAATQALDANTQDLGKAIGSVYGDDAEKAFLPLWRKHIEFFVNYTVAGAKGDAAGQTKAKSDLDGYRSDFGAFLAGANPNLTKQAVANELVPHVDSLLVAIDAVLAKSSDVAKKVTEAAAIAPKTGTALATAIAKQYPAKFV
ncbi:MAG: hypothetical protein ACRDJ4_15530 [Actinomycetota bacterium]